VVEEGGEVAFGESGLRLGRRDEGSRGRGEGVRGRNLMQTSTKGEVFLVGVSD